MQYIVTNIGLTDIRQINVSNNLMKNAIKKSKRKKWLLKAKYQDLVIRNYKIDNIKELL